MEDYENYIELGKQFIHEVVAYAGNTKLFTDRLGMYNLIKRFNAEKNRNVDWEAGLTRYVMIEKCYVIKVDYNATQSFGGNRTECAMYEKAQADGMEYLFCPATLYTYEGIDFEIMPRLWGIGKDSMRDGIDGFLDFDEELEYVHANCDDIHSENFAYDCDFGVKIIDYAMNIFMPNFKPSVG